VSIAATDGRLLDLLKTVAKRLHTEDVRDLEGEPVRLGEMDFPPRISPVEQFADESGRLQFPSIIYRATGGAFEQAFGGQRQLQIRYMVRIFAAQHEHLGLISDVLLAELASVQDFQGPADDLLEVQGQRRRDRGVGPADDSQDSTLENTVYVRDYHLTVRSGRAIRVSPTESRGDNGDGGDGGPVAVTTEQIRELLAEGLLLIDDTLAGDAGTEATRLRVAHPFSQALEDRILGVEAGAQVNPTGAALAAALDAALGTTVWRQGADGVGLNQAAVDARIASLVEASVLASNPSLLLPPGKTPRLLHYGQGAPAAVADAKAGDFYARIDSGRISSLYTASGGPAVSWTKVGDWTGLTQDQVDARIKAWARKDATTRIPEDLIDEGITRDTELAREVTALEQGIAGRTTPTEVGTIIGEDVQPWALRGTGQEIPGIIEQRVPEGGDPGQRLTKTGTGSAEQEWRDPVPWSKAETTGFSPLTSAAPEHRKTFELPSEVTEARDRLGRAIPVDLYVRARTAAGAGQDAATAALRIRPGGGGIIASTAISYPDGSGSDAGAWVRTRLGFYLTSEADFRADLVHTGGGDIQIDEIRAYFPDSELSVSYGRVQGLREGERNIALENVQGSRIMDSDGVYRRDITPGNLITISTAGVIDLPSLDTRTGKVMPDQIFSTAALGALAATSTAGSATGLHTLTFTSRQVIAEGTGLTYDSGSDRIRVTEPGTYLADVRIPITSVDPGGLRGVAYLQVSRDGGTTWDERISVGYHRAAPQAGEAIQGTGLLAFTTAADNLLFRLDLNDNDRVGTVTIGVLTLHLRRLAGAEGDNIFQSVLRSNTRADGAAIGLDMHGAGLNNSRLVHYILDNRMGGVDITLPDSLSAAMQSATLTQGRIWSRVTVLGNEHPISIHDHRDRQDTPADTRLHVYSDIPGVPVTASTGFAGQYWLGYANDRVAPAYYDIYWDGTRFSMSGKIRSSVLQSFRQLTQQRDRWFCELDLSESKTAAAFGHATTGELARTWGTRGSTADRPEVGWSVAAIRSELSDYQHPTGSDARIPITCYPAPASHLRGLMVQSAYLVRRATQDHAQAGIVVKLVNNRPNTGSSNSGSNDITVGLQDKFFFSLPDWSAA